MKAAVFFHRWPPISIGDPPFPTCKTLPLGTLPSPWPRPMFKWWFGENRFKWGVTDGNGGSPMEKNCCFHTILCICLYTKTAANQLTTVRASGKGAAAPPVEGGFDSPSSQSGVFFTYCFCFCRVTQVRQEGARCMYSNTRHKTTSTSRWAKLNEQQSFIFSLQVGQQSTIIHLFVGWIILICICISFFMKGEMRLAGQEEEQPTFIISFHHIKVRA